MPEEAGRYIRIPVATAPSGHKIRTIVISRREGNKALYDVDAKKLITYIFDKSKDWTMETSKEWVRNRKRIKECVPITVDQLPGDFVKLCVRFTDDTEEVYTPSNGVAFKMTDEMIEEDLKMIYLHKAEAAGDPQEKADKKTAIFCPNCGWTGEGKTGCDCPDCKSKTKAKGSKTKEKSEDEDVTKEFGAESVSADGNPPEEIGTDVKAKAEEDPDINQAMEIIKADKLKQIVYGVFLWPDKADHDGDIIAAEDIEKVAHKFIIEYRDIDEMHKKQTTEADIVESFIAWKDNLEYFGKMLKQGAWAGAIHIQNADVWEKVEKGEYRGFSVRITGKREPVGDNYTEDRNR